MAMALLTEHVGSLLRPEPLLEARRLFTAGQITAADLHAAEDAAILGALHAQAETGIDVVNDGEYRRTDFRAGFAAAVSGLREEEFERPWKSDAGPVLVRSRLWRVTGPVTQTGPIATEEASFVAAHTALPYKVTLPSPGFMAERFFTPDDRSPYSTVAELTDAFGEILGDEITRLVRAGVPYVQIDNPGYASFLDEESRSRMAARGRDPEQALAEMLDGDRRLLATARGAGTATLGLHVCRGNNASSWMNQGSYDLIAERLFASLPVDRLLLEYDDSRSGGFECLRFLPPGKVAVLGLISTKVAAVEEPDDLLRRLEEAARFVDPAQLALSPQCGFATHAEGGNHLTADEQYRKLAVAVETMRRWSGRG